MKEHQEDDDRGIEKDALNPSTASTAVIQGLRSQVVVHILDFTMNPAILRKTIRARAKLAEHHNRNSTPHGTTKTKQDAGAKVCTTPQRETGVGGAFWHSH